MLYALLYFGCMRFGEATALRWSDRLDTKPLRALHIYNEFNPQHGKKLDTKTDTPRKMPEHPTLTKILNEWKLGGWAEYFVRAPKDDDLTIPSRRGLNRRKNHSLHKLHEDLGRPDLRPRRQRDLRRSLISPDGRRWGQPRAIETHYPRHRRVGDGVVRHPCLEGLL